MLANADHVRDFKRANVSLSLTEYEQLAQAMNTTDRSQLATAVRELALERASQITQAHTQCTDASAEMAVSNLTLFRVSDWVDSTAFLLVAHV